MNRPPLCLPSHPVSIERLFSVGRMGRWLVALVTQSRKMKDLFSSETRVNAYRVLGGFWVDGSGCLQSAHGAQSRASSGWVFSLSPRSSCFSMPASTTDWDLKGRTGTCQRGLLQKHSLSCSPFALLHYFCFWPFSPP